MANSFKKVDEKFMTPTTAAKLNETGSTTIVNNSIDEDKLTQAVRDKLASIASKVDATTVNQQLATMENGIDARLDAVEVLIGPDGADGNTTITHVKDLLAIFLNYPEGRTILDEFNKKVDKVAGKQLTTVDFTQALKDKLDGLQNTAPTPAYSHPNHTGDVTSTGDGATLIGEGKVTNAHLAPTIKVGSLESLSNSIQARTDVVSAINATYNAIGQAVAGLLVNGKIKPEYLTALVFDEANFNGTGTVADPYKVDKSDIMKHLTTLPGWKNDNTVTLTGDFTWVAREQAPPTQTQLTTSTLTLATPDSNTVNTSWTAVPNATNYVLQRASDSAFSTNLINLYSGTNLSFVDTGRVPSTQYYYRVKAQASNYIDSIYDAKTITTPALPQLAAPNLVLAVQSSTHIYASWQAVTNATSYVLERATDVSFTQNLSVIYSGNALIYNDINKTPSTTYYYRLKAIATGYTDSNFDVENATTQAPPQTQLGTSSLTAATASESQINLTWVSVPNATTYTLQRASTSAFTDAVTIYSGPNLFYNDGGRTQATTYHYRLQATGTGYTASAYAFANATTNSITAPTTGIQLTSVSKVTAPTGAVLPGTTENAPTSFTSNSLPQAIGVKIVNKYQYFVGATLQSGFDYKDFDGQAAGNHTYKWFRRDNVGTITQINGANGATYTIANTLLKFGIAVEVTPKSIDGVSGIPVMSPFTNFVVNPDPTNWVSSNIGWAGVSNSTTTATTVTRTADGSNGYARSLQGFVGRGYVQVKNNTFRTYSGYGGAKTPGNYAGITGNAFGMNAVMQLHPDKAEAWVTGGRNHTEFGFVPADAFWRIYRLPDVDASGNEIAGTWVFWLTFCPVENGVFKKIKKLPNTVNGTTPVGLDFLLNGTFYAGQGFKNLKIVGESLATM